MAAPSTGGRIELVDFTGFVDFDVATGVFRLTCTGADRAAQPQRCAADVSSPSALPSSPALSSSGADWTDSCGARGTQRQASSVQPS
eukprot:1141813-Lingulodinium_polyedra.AAC.1